MVSADVGESKINLTFSQKGDKILPLNYKKYIDMKNLLKKIQQKQEENTLLLGKKVWDDVTKSLPKAIGVIEDDTPRVKKFAKAIKKLNKKSQKAVKKWLEQQIHDLNYYAPDLMTGREEEALMRQSQIYRHHLEAIS